MEEAHSGGVRLVASELNAVASDERSDVLKRLQRKFKYPIRIVRRERLPSDAREQFDRGDDVVFYWVPRYGGLVATPLDDGEHVLNLGPFPDYAHIERGLGGGLRIAADKLRDASDQGREREVLDELRYEFDYEIAIIEPSVLPVRARKRILDGENVVFYENDDESAAFIAVPLNDSESLVRFGPFPNFDIAEQRALATTLGFVLILAAIAIALLLRPVARDLRRVEGAARLIANGDLTARVGERRARTVQPLANAFDQMASRTETLVRTQRELLQAVSHELRTPLSRMRFAVELIGSAKDDAERKRRLTSLENSTEELDQLVGELLSYVRMETESQIVREPIDFSEALGQLLPNQSTLNPTIDFDFNGHQLTIRSASELSDGDLGESNGRAPSTVVDADRKAFLRAIGNLLSNAGRHANSKVTVRAESVPGATIVDVDDDGDGIDEADRHRVLEPFVRLDDGTNGSGVGLGLALVNRIVAQHEGSVQVLDSPLGGCRVRTTWPTN
jgi:two-component system sensor histidine kinase RstB